MKTTKVMRRNMGDFEVLQRTSDSFFRADTLLREWNKTHEGKRRRDMNRFFSQRGINEFIEELKLDISGSLKRETADYEVVKIVISRNPNIPKEIYLHPYL